MVVEEGISMERLRVSICHGLSGNSCSIIANLRQKIAVFIIVSVGSP